MLLLSLSANSKNRSSAFDRNLEERKNAGKEITRKLVGVSYFAESDLPY